jgi:hypothetical protein
VRCKRAVTLIAQKTLKINADKVPNGGGRWSYDLPCGVQKTSVRFTNRPLSIIFGVSGGSVVQSEIQTRVRKNHVSTPLSSGSRPLARRGRQR